MLFNSLQYALFLPVVLLLYYCARGQLRLWVLLLGSYFFYASWNWVYLFLIVGLTVLNFGIGLGLSSLYKRDRMTRAGWLLALGIVLNLGVLGFYKYASFFIVNMVGLLSALGLNLKSPEFNPVLPLAISFFC